MPAEFTVAMAGWELVHMIVLLVASGGVMVAVNVVVSLIGSRMPVSAIVMPVTGMYTVIVLVAVKFPSCVVAVIMVVPSVMPVTSPLEFTVATVGVSLVQMMVWLLASAGVIVALTGSVWPMGSCFVLSAIVMPVTGVCTVIMAVAVCPESVACTMNSVVPLPTAVTSPVAGFIVAMFGLPVSIHV